MTTGDYHFQRRQAQRPPGGGFEFSAWFFMRVSGVLLIVLAVFHLLYMHMVIRVETSTLTQS